VILRKKEIEELAKTSDMAQVMVDRANEVATTAKGNAPVSKAGSHGRRAGYLRANIRTKWARDQTSVYADVITAARTPKGYPYGRRQEQLQPYLKPAIE
jgi:hypothetical protein